MADSETPEIAQETAPAAAPAAPAWLAGLAKRPFAVLALLGLLLWLPGVLSLPALDRDESRFAQSSRQMLDSGNFVDIRFGDVAVPDPVGIHHNVWPVLALIETSGLIRPNASLQSAVGQLLLE